MKSQDELVFDPGFNYREDDSDDDDDVSRFLEVETPRFLE